MSCPKAKWLRQDSHQYKYSQTDMARYSHYRAESLVNESGKLQGQPSQVISQKQERQSLFTLVCNALGGGGIAQPNFQMLSRPPRAHRKAPHLSNPHYSFAKKEVFWKKQNQNNSCPFCNNLLNSTCRTRGNYLPRYKRRQALSSLMVACVTARLPYTSLLLWGPAGNAKAPPTWLQLVSPTQSPETLVWWALCWVTEYDHWTRR